jgi:hypothetical protein
MKKVISVLSFLLIITASSCRNINAEQDNPGTEEWLVPTATMQRDSAASSASGDGKDEEPRKDLQQWKQK